MFRPGSRPGRSGGVLSPPSTVVSSVAPHVPSSTLQQQSSDVMLSQAQYHQLAMDRMKSEHQQQQQHQQRFLEMHHANKPELTLRTSEPPRQPKTIGKPRQWFGIR